MLTLQDCQTIRFQTVSGFSTASEDFLEILNDVVTQLYNRGDFSGTLKPIQVMAQNGCLTWPRYVASVRKMHSCRDGTIPIGNQFYQFLDHRGRHKGWEGWRGEERQMDYEYKSPVYADIQGTGNVVQLYVDVAQDVGTQVTIFGLDDNGNQLQTQNGDGTWSPGVTLTAISPYASSTTNISKILRVVCQTTNSNKRLYAYNAAAGSTYPLAVYGPAETDPSYVRYKLKGGWPNQCAGKTFSVLALVKLALIPIKNPQDLVIIDNREALLDGFKAIKASDAGNYAVSDKLWSSAVEKLNRQLENDFPDDTFAAQDNTFGDNRCLTNHCY